MPTHMELKHNVLRQQRVLLVNLYPPPATTTEVQQDATEMYNLVTSLGDAVVIDMLHQRGYPAKDAYIGTGKAAEVAAAVKELSISTIILNGIAKPRQLFRLTQLIEPINPNIIVWDRIDLILNIFEKHARTAEAKLQIEIARMRHMGPRIYGMGHVLSQQGGGIGTRGIGETNVELMKRHWKEAMRQAQGKLSALAQQRQHQIDQRREAGFKTISIVGYTNAGKTTLFNRIARKGKYADNLLFATLESTVGKVYLTRLRQEIVVSDTIGFIRNLPPALIDAFRSTLIEAIHAQGIIHVVDGSDPTAVEQYHVVESILSDIGAADTPEILVFNKADAMSADMQQTLQERFYIAKPIFISAKHGTGLDLLLQSMEDCLCNPDSSERKKSMPTRLPARPELYPGQSVVIVEKENQPSGIETQGEIEAILSRGFSHPYGIKVQLRSGAVGRVKRVIV